MHFSAAALCILSCLGLSNAAPFAYPQDDALVPREPTYSVVNVDGGSSSSSAVTEVETVIETMTVPGPTSKPVTVTVTATPSVSRASSFSVAATPSSSRVASSSSVAATSTPLYRSLETPSPSCNVPLPTHISPSWWRRGLNAYGSSVAPSGYGNPSAISYSASVPVSATTPVARGWRAPSSTSSWTVQSTPWSSSEPISATPRFY